ncbi:MAG: PRC-barrel domain-containing protein [Patescibacteria group bacterium]
MFIEARKLINLPVAAMDISSKIGTIREVLIDPENGRLLGFLIKTGGILGVPKVLSAVDIREFDPNGIVTDSIENIVEAKEIVRINEVLTKKILLLGMKAKTQAGKRLGVVENFLLDTETESVVKYYLKDLVGGPRIFPADKVVKIDKEIIFTDDIEKIPPGAVGQTA